MDFNSYVSCFRTTTTPSTRKKSTVWHCLMVRLTAHHFAFEHANTHKEYQQRVSQSIRDVSIITGREKVEFSIRGNQVLTKKKNADNDKHYTTGSNRSRTYHNIENKRHQCPGFLIVQNNTGISRIYTQCLPCCCPHAFSIYTLLRLLGVDSMTRGFLRDLQCRYQRRLHLLRWLAVVCV